jgi:hypothetical protein
MLLPPPAAAAAACIRFSMFTSPLAAMREVADFYTTD